MYFIVTGVRLYISRHSMVFTPQSYGKCKLAHDVVGLRPATSWVHYITSCNTKSSVPKDGQNNCPKHV